MRKLILSILIVVMSLSASAQWQMLDTVFFNSGLQNYRVRVWYNPSLPDSCQGIFFLPGVGQFTTDTAGLAVAGPVDYLRTGWDGGVDLGNGRHYPIIVNVQPNGTAWGRPDFLGPRIFDWAMGRFRIKKNSVHFTGLSQGGWSSNLMVTYQATSGVLTYGTRIKSVVNVQGVKPDDTYGATPAFPGRFTPYAQAGGKELGFWGTLDGDRSIPDIVNTMNAAVSGSAYVFSDAVGHNTFQRYYGGDGPTDGSTYYAPIQKVINGTLQDLYQWMLRQGDTVNTYHVASGNSTPTANAGTDKTITLPYSAVYLYGTGNDTDGSIASYSWSKVSGPYCVIRNATSRNPVITNLHSGSYTFRLTVTDDQGATGTDDIVVTVNSQPSAGTGINNMIIGEYLANIIDSTYKGWGLGSNGSLLGVGTSSAATVPKAMTSPDSIKIITGAAGLHHGVFIDGNRELWHFGENLNGQAGIGTISSYEMNPVKITVDSAGNYFGNVKKAMCYYVANDAVGTIVLKYDSTLWIAGDTRYGLRGNGYAGNSTTSKFVQITPAGRKVIDFNVGEVITAICDDGTVKTTGGGGFRLQNLGRGASPDYTSWGNVTGLSGTITKVAGASSFYWAVASNGNIFGWGYYGCYLGYGSGGYANNTPLNTATNLTSTLSFPSAIDTVVANTETSYFLLTNGDLYALGGTDCGSVGNGRGINWATYPTPYSWSGSPSDTLQQTPVKVLSNVTDVWSGTAYTFYVYAKKSNGSLYSWGRNKGAILGNGIVHCSSSQASTYPNAFDVTTPKQVWPLQLTTAYSIPAPICYTSPGATDCSGCTLPNPPTVNAGSNQTVSITTASLTGSATPASGLILTSIQWSRVSGSGTIASASSASTSISGLATGTNTFRFTATQIDGQVVSDDIDVVVSVPVSTNAFKFRKGVKIKIRQTN